MPRPTHAFVLAQSPLTLLCFGAAVVDSSVYLGGAGSTTGDGYPMPFDGYALTIQVWDGGTLRSDSAQVAISAGDRLSCYAFWAGANFTVRLRINGINTSLQVTAVPDNVTLTATISVTQTVV